MPTYFSLAELLRSDTAAARNIDNTPSWEVVDHLRELGDLPHPTGVCIWDAAFSGEGWLTPAVWSSLAVLQAREAKLAR